MLYQRGSFTVPATAKSIISCDQGHAMLDTKSRCIRCGEKVELACTDKDHRFNGEQLTCACGTTKRRRITSHNAVQLTGFAKR